MVDNDVYSASQIVDLLQANDIRYYSRDSSTTSTSRISTPEVELYTASSSITPEVDFFDGDTVNLNLLVNALAIEVVLNNPSLDSVTIDFGTLLGFEQSPYWISTKALDSTLNIYARSFFSPEVDVYVNSDIVFSGQLTIENGEIGRIEINNAGGGAGGAVGTGVSVNFSNEEFIRGDTIRVGG
ncbi:MAG: hypothetical protein HRT61_08590 [Ekhidna sp.]|nr:hypothetical protein [Ekhidna sp.]